MPKETSVDLRETGPVGVTNEELKSLLEDNLRLTQEVHDMTHKIKGYITFQKFMAFFYLFIIIAPIIISILYLPPLLKNVIGQYEELLSPGASIQNLLKSQTPPSSK